MRFVFFGKKNTHSLANLTIFYVSGPKGFGRQIFLLLVKRFQFFGLFRLFFQTFAAILV